MPDVITKGQLTQEEQAHIKALRLLTPGQRHALIVTTNHLAEIRARKIPISAKIIQLRRTA